MLTVVFAVIVSQADQEHDFMSFSMETLSTVEVQNNRVVKLALSDLSSQP